MKTSLENSAPKENSSITFLSLYQNGTLLAESY